MSLLECVVGFLLCIRCVSQAPTPGRGSGQSLLLNLVLLLHSPLPGTENIIIPYTRHTETQQTQGNTTEQPEILNGKNG